MSFAKILLFLTTVMPHFLGSLAEFTKVPKNQVSSVETQNTVMECHSSEGKISWFCVSFWSVEKELWNGYLMRRNTTFCSIDNSTNGQRNLNIKPTREAAQTYVCLEPGTFNRVSAELIYIKSDLTTHSDNSSGDLVNLMCSIEFRGNWAPTIEWTEQSIHGEKVLSAEVNTTTVPNQLVTSALVMPVQDGSRNYTCTAKFNISGKPINTTAINVPEYTKSWTSTMFIKHEAKSTNMTGAVIAATVIGSVIMIATLFIVFCICAKSRKEKKRKQKENQLKSGNESTCIFQNGERQEQSQSSPLMTKPV